MVLRRKLLRRKLESSDHLLGKNCGLGVTEGIESDLTDKGIVWHHHSHWSEKGLQVVGKLRSTGITRIHGNENAEGLLHLNLTFLEEKFSFISSLSTEKN
jgi:hypothetical protein